MSTLMVVMGSQVAWGQYRPSLGSSSGTLGRIGRETRTNSPIYDRQSVLQQLSRYQQDVARMGTGSGSSALTSGGSGSARRRYSGANTVGRLSTGLSSTPLLTTFSATREYVPYRSIPMAGSLGTHLQVERLSGRLTPEQLGSQKERRLLLDRSGVQGIASVYFAPDLLVRERSNPLPAPVIAAANPGLVGAFRTHSAPLADPDLVDLPESTPVTVEALWRSNIQTAYQSRLDAGWEEFSVGDSTAALSAFRDAEIADPSQALPRAGQVCAQLARGQYASAGLTLKRVLEVDGQSGLSLEIDFMEKWDRPENLRQALLGAQNLALIYPDQVEAKAIVAYLRWYSGDRTDAMRIAREIKTMKEPGVFAGLEEAMVHANQSPSPVSPGEGTS